jgi:hypothetical protein
MIETIIGVLVIYGIGFFLGKKYEKDKMLDGVYGVLSTINKTDLVVDSVTYYYNKEAYDKKVAELKECGEDYYEQ